MLSVSSDLFMDGPFWPHLAGDAHIGESPCRRAENGGLYVCFAASAVVIVAFFLWLVHRARRLITTIANVVQVALCSRRFNP